MDFQCKNLQIESSNNTKFPTSSSIPVRDTLSDFAIATSKSVEKLVCNAMSSSWGGQIANQGLIQKSISEGEFPSVPGCVRYPPIISARQSSKHRSLLQTVTFRSSRFNVPSILCTFFSFWTASLKYRPTNRSTKGIVSNCCTAKIGVYNAQN